MFQVLMNVVLSASVYLLVSRSYSLIYFTTKVFHLAHGAIIAFGAYFTSSLINFFPLPLAALFAVLASTLIGILCEVLVYERMRINNTKPISYLIASLGLYVVLSNCTAMIWGNQAKTIDLGNAGVGHEIFGAYLTSTQLITIFISILAFASTSLFLQLTSIGKSIRAVASNPELCNVYGINSSKIIRITYGIGSWLGAITGLLIAMDTNMTPTFGFNTLLYGIVAMIIGGTGSSKGLIAGSLLVALSQHIVAYLFDTKWMDSVTYIVLIAFLVWRPLGFSGKRLKKVEV